MVKRGRSYRTASRFSLETERLSLRALSGEDLGAAHCIFDDPDVRRHLFDDEPVSIEAARSLLQRSGRDFAAGGVGLFGIRVTGEDELVGFCGFFVIEEVGEPEMTYGLVPARWGRGFGTEVARTVTRYALETAGFRRVLVATEEANVASLRIIEKLGGRPLGGILPGHPEVSYFEIRQGHGSGRPGSDRKGQQ